MCIVGVRRGLMCCIIRSRGGLLRKPQTPFTEILSFIVCNNNIAAVLRSKASMRSWSGRVWGVGMTKASNKAEI